MRSMINPMLPSSIIDLEPEVDLEFKTYTYQCGTSEWIDGAVEMNVANWLNEGWQLDNQIICPPFVMLIFSREKEEKETANNE